MKNIFTLLLFLITSQILAQIPAGYYDSSRDLSGDSLHSALYRTISGHTEFPYTSSAIDTWDLLKESDRDPDNPDNVILIYTGKSVDAAQEWNGGAGWAREHVWAKIHGDFGTDKGAGTDAHHLRPVHQPTNSARNSRWFDECETPFDSLGNFKCEESWAWEPRDAMKGDIARMILYMDVRYEGQNGEPDLQVIDSIPSVNHTTEPVHAKLSTLMQWHLNDPVSDWERNRNEVIYNFQGNRNPFIDKPDFACLIWPETCAKLPIEISVFDVAVGVNKVLINWTTVVETGTSHFEIERSTDGNMWRSIHTEDAAGNSQMTLSYSYTDTAPLPGANYYRIKTVDQNGLFCHTPIKMVTMEEAISELTIFPNPNDGNFSVQLEMAEYYPIIVEVFDPIGRLLYEDAFLAGNGLVTQPVDISGLAPGLYFVRLKVAEETRIGTVMKR